MAESSKETHAQVELSETEKILKWASRVNKVELPNSLVKFSGQVPIPPNFAAINKTNES